MSNELEFKVIGERIDGSMIFHDWDNEKGARRYFNSLKNEKKKVTVWAELLFASIIDDAVDEVVVVDDFSRKVLEVLGYKVIV